jgi:cyanophycin synthetase
VQNALAAALMAYAMGVKVDNIRQALRTFDTSYFQVPGRLNVYDELPFKVILDYGHNPAAVRAMAAPGDRRNEDILEMARIIGESRVFAHIYLKRDDDLRGRGATEIPDLMRRGLTEAGSHEERITTIPDERECVDAALHTAQRDDLLLIFGDAISRCWKQVTKYQPGADTARRNAERPPPPPIDPGLFSGEPAPALGGDALVEDARGVILARDGED